MFLLTLRHSRLGPLIPPCLFCCDVTLQLILRSLVNMPLHRGETLITHFLGKKKIGKRRNGSPLAWPLKPGRRNKPPGLTSTVRPHTRAASRLSVSVCVHLYPYTLLGRSKTERKSERHANPKKESNRPCRGGVFMREREKYQRKRNRSGESVKCRCLSLSWNPPVSASHRAAPTRLYSPLPHLRSPHQAEPPC